MSKDSSFSRYYSSQKFGHGATRIDRLYHYGGVYSTKSEYKATAFSDHWAQIVTYHTPDVDQCSRGPKIKPTFKISYNVIDDDIFQKSLKSSVEHLITLKNHYNYPVLDWWELLVKPGIKKLAIERSKEINKSRRGKLDLLYLLLLHETSKLKKVDIKALEEVKKTQVLIEE